MADFESQIAATAAALDAAFAELMPKADGPRGRLIEAMTYGLLGGGKRLRGLLVLQSSALFDVPRAQAVNAAAAVEMVHAYSLIHDDLPVMDDSPLRRGRPSTHVAFDEVTAVLAGDALLPLAFEILTRPSTHPDSAVRLALVEALAQASGALGMAGGQMIDIDAENRPEPLTLAEIEQLQDLKTGALFCFCCEAGALLGRAGEGEKAALRAYAASFGLAFQIVDDLLDSTGDEAALGKPTGQDAALNKATFVSLLGQEEAARRAQSLITQCIESLETFGAKADPLKETARFVLSRHF